jgi:CRISPR-associated endonuclease/helicase Cas3
MDDFDAAFCALTGNPPFPWQRALYEEWFAQGKFPDACTLPTGLGKTSVVAVWLLALAANPGKVPRRLVYVVNRRTVVDQTTAEVEKYRQRLLALPVILDQLRGLCAVDEPVVPYRPEPLALSTLRGQFADNREWSGDPARPAVVVGTVDMIGSRLLFSGYGCGFKTRPLHAGFLGQDALLVHDEAHLEPAFQTLVEAIRDEQRRRGEFRPFHVTALTATPRNTTNVFRLTDADGDNATVKARLGATKKLTLHPLKDAKKPAAELATKALAFKESGRAVLVFARSVEAVQQIIEALNKDKTKKHVEQLTGTLRGLERDALAKSNEAFARFLPPGDRKCKAADDTVYLVCTSAGEVGVNLSADHLVSDLTPFDSMAQRFGRVNRFGAATDSEIHVLYPPSFDPTDALGPPCERTLALLGELNSDASPAALGKLEDERKIAAFTPSPTILPTSDILFDAWALTTVRGRLPGRPPVEPYLHGLASWEPPETHVAWREEVSALDPKYSNDEERVARLVMDRKRLAAFAADLLGDYPLKPHELLRDRSSRVFDQLALIARRRPHLPAWLIDDDGVVTIYALADLADKVEKERLEGRTVVLSPEAGGLTRGMLTGSTADTAECDVADRWFDSNGQSRRQKFRSDEAQPERIPGMRLVREYDTRPEKEDNATEAAEAEDEDTSTAAGRYYRWYVRQASGDDDGPKMSEQPIPWPHHTQDVIRNAERIAPQLLADRPELQKSLTMAARLHDLGKHRKVWQRSIGNSNPATLYEKGGRRWKPIELTDYRHEFGSLLDAAGDAEFVAFNSDERELVLHLIAAHHGRGRPHFSTNEAFDPEHQASAAAAVARVAPQRYARLQRKYGRWGLAYLESLLRAADYAASANPSEFEKGGGL